jgi:hypothetical protein
MSNQISQLPELIRSCQARKLLGLSKDKYYALLEARPDYVAIIPGSKERKFRKRALIEILM